MKGETYRKIEEVLQKAGRALAPHEFDTIAITVPGEGFVRGREYIGQSEASIARRLREMRFAGRITGKKRDGKNYVEYALPVAVMAD